MTDEKLLGIYKTLKEKGLLKEVNPEYEAMLKEEEHKKEFKKWHDSLPEQERKDFDYIFGK